MFLFLAEIIPAVTVPPKPKGLPIAITQSPSLALSEFPKVKQCFTVRVKQPADLLVSSSVNAISHTISFELNGANKYYIKLNDKYYTTDKTRIELPITKEINEIEVSTDIECQGFSRECLVLYEDCPQTGHQIVRRRRNVQRDCKHRHARSRAGGEGSV